LNIRQKKLVSNSIVVLVFTVAMVTTFANIKNVINRSEAMRATELVGQEVLRYRKANGSLPPEYYVKEYINEIGAVRLSNFHYRAPWIEFGSEPNNTILAYSEKDFRGFVKAGGIVLWLNGKVEWMNKKQFKQSLAAQQKQQELQWIKERLQSGENQP
jgi:hypothetical protein